MNFFMLRKRRQWIKPKSLLKIKKKKNKELNNTTNYSTKTSRKKWKIIFFECLNLFWKVHLILNERLRDKTQQLIQFSNALIYSLKFFNEKGNWSWGVNWCLNSIQSLLYIKKEIFKLNIFFMLFNQSRTNVFLFRNPILLGKN